MGDEFSLEDALIILQRRILFFLIPVIVLAPLGILFVMMLPPKYTAQGTILVESQQIPEDWAPSTIIADAQERIQTIRQRVITRNRLLEVADKFQLFPRELGLSESERVELMRERLRINPITTQVNRRGRRGDGTIAFRVSYEDRAPNKAHEVANEFMSLFLSEDVRARTTAASDTTEFFTSEVKRLSTAVDTLEANISAFKIENAQALPEHLNLHLDMMERANRELNSTQATIAGHEEELGFMESQLSNVLSGAGGQEGPAQQIQALRSQLARLRATFTDANPSVRALQDEIRALERQMQPSAEIKKLTDELEEARTALNEAQAAATVDPAVVNEKRKAVETANERLSEQFTSESQNSNGNFLSSQLNARIASTRSRIDLAKARQVEIRAQVESLQARINQTPDVDRRLSALTRNYESLQREYQEVLSKQQAAELAENLEDNQKAEKFRVLEAAVRPEKPSSPERGKLSVLAIIAALGVGGIAALGAEMLFATIRGRNHLSKLIDDHPIAVIPYIKRENEKRPSMPFTKKKAAKAPAIAASAALAVGAVATVDGDLGNKPAGNAPSENI